MSSEAIKRILGIFSVRDLMTPVNQLKRADTVGQAEQGLANSRRMKGTQGMMKKALNEAGRKDFDLDEHEARGYQS